MKQKKRKLLWLLGILLLGYWLFCLPNTLFVDPLATVVEDQQGQLLGARIAADGQWRFPALDSLPYRFEQCILHFEDEHFYKHPGFNPVSMGKALYQNLTTDTHRGGSTLTQQVIRLSRKGQQRTYWEKGVELLQATRLETRYSKKEILNLYATYAPFGGNVVGLETASWRYYGMPAHALSWGQTAALAVLPNAPAVVLPGKNETTLSRKRNALLKKLWEKDVIDETTYELALLESLPGKPVALPQLASHLVEHINKEKKGQRIQTTIDGPLQKDLNRLARTYYERYRQNEVYNLSIVVFDVTSKTVLGYVGNSPTDAAHQKDVDIVQRPRSTGSTLKPMLFTGLLDAGLLLPNTLIADVPTSINGYRPENFDRTYSGMVPASKALAQSLNVPAVRMLQQYGLERFYNDLQSMKLDHIDRSTGYYGLSLVLGGAESSLWELTKTYAGLGHTLNTYTQTSSEYPSLAFEGYGFKQKERGSPEVSYPLATSSLSGLTINKTSAKEKKNDLLMDPPVFDAGAIYHTLDALRNVNRPDGSAHWEFYEDSQPIAWKTGTSYGFKDAWAVGVTPQYAIGVWVGNADGEGRPGITGIQAAAPLFFDVLRQLPNNGQWFAIPYDALVEDVVCMESGQKAGSYCTNTQKVWIPSTGIHTTSCSYHKPIFLNLAEDYQVHSGCFELEEIHIKPKFVLPPIAEYYYAQRHPEYKLLPPLHPDCQWEADLLMDFVFPKEAQDIILPKDFDETINDVIFKVAHRNPETTLYWYLDDTFMGSTTTFHELAVNPRPGNYLLTVVDASGNELKQKVAIVKN